MVGLGAHLLMKIPCDIVVDGVVVGVLGDVMLDPRGIELYDVMMVNYCA